MITSGQFEFDFTLTLDGLMTLIAGIIAFVAIILQIRSSNSLLNKQLQDAATAEARVRRNRHTALVRAFRLELERIHEFMIKNISPAVAFLDTSDFRFPKTIATLDESSFVVFRGNSAFLGELQGETVQSLFDFYTHASACFDLVRSYLWTVQEEVTRDTILLKSGAAYSSLQEIRRMIDLIKHFSDEAKKCLAAEETSEHS